MSELPEVDPAILQAIARRLFRGVGEDFDTLTDAQRAQDLELVARSSATAAVEAFANSPGCRPRWMTAEQWVDYRHLHHEGWTAQRAGDFPRARAARERMGAIRPASVELHREAMLPAHDPNTGNLPARSEVVL